MNIMRNVLSIFNIWIFVLLSGEGSEANNVVSHRAPIKHSNTRDVGTYLKALNSFRNGTIKNIGVRIQSEWYELNPVSIAIAIVSFICCIMCACILCKRCCCSNNSKVVAE